MNVPIKPKVETYRQLIYDNLIQPEIARGKPTVIVRFEDLIATLGEHHAVDGRHANVRNAMEAWDCDDFVVTWTGERRDRVTSITYLVQFQTRRGNRPAATSAGASD